MTMTINNHQYEKVRVILNLENWSRFTLLDSRTDVHCGEVLPAFQVERYSIIRWALAGSNMNHLTAA